jgi:NADPH2:quinone reductase
MTREELLDRIGDVFRWMGEGKLKIAIDKTYPLAEAGAAHQYLEGRHSKGKILLIP